MGAGAGAQGLIAQEEETSSFRAQSLLPLIWILPSWALSAGLRSSLWVVGGSVSLWFRTGGGAPFWVLPSPPHRGSSPGPSSSCLAPAPHVSMGTGAPRACAQPRHEHRGLPALVCVPRGRKGFAWGHPAGPAPRVDSHYGAPPHCVASCGGPRHVLCSWGAWHTHPWSDHIGPVWFPCRTQF